MPALEHTLDFILPPQLEAHDPPEIRGFGRDDVRLLVSNRATGAIAHAEFRDLPRVLQPGDLLVVNTSGTLPAEVDARTEEGVRFPLRLSTRLGPQTWSVEPRELRPHPDMTVSLPDGASARFLQPYIGSSRLWVAELHTPVDIIEYLLEHGRPIRYSYVPRAWPLEMYSTVFAHELGSAEMPSAARPFTLDMVRRLERTGVGIARILLHCGVSSLESGELPYPEPYRVPPETADEVNATRAAGGRVIAVGTTVVRALETVADLDGTVHTGVGWTDLVVTPERGVRAVDGLLTGLHEPRATHLAMLEAIAHRDHLAAAYEAALSQRYLWHEFGDVHLIL